MSACGSDSNVSPIDLSSDAKVTQVDCRQVHDVANEVTRIVRTLSGKNQSDAEKAWNITPDTAEHTVSALTARSEQCTDPSKAAPLKGTGTPVVGNCPDQFVQHFDPNNGGNFVSAGVKNTDDEMKAMATDARYLAFRANNLGLMPDTNPAPLLAPDNTCLSQEGTVMWGEVKGALTGTGVTVDTNAQAPTNSYNTGMVNGQPVADSQPGIGGDTTATKYTLRDGSSLYVMHRCGNLALPSQGNLPKGSTDNRRPPGQTPPPPPPGCTTCATTTPPPPGCTNCLDTKVPTQAPGNGGAGDGGSSEYGGNGGDRHTADPTPAPPAGGNPPPTYNAPPPPTHSTPTGSTPTTITSVPPPETSANPPGGGGNNGDPGGF